MKMRALAWTLIGLVVLVALQGCAKEEKSPAATEQQAANQLQKASTDGAANPEQSKMGN